MRKHLCLILIILLFLPSLALASEDVFTFRNGITFGMTASEVIDCEGKAPDLSSDTLMSYSNEQSAEKAVTILYVFPNGQLTQILLLFDDVHDDPDDYISEYLTFDALLTQKYDEPTIPRFFRWADDSYANSNRSAWGALLNDGKLDLFTQWTLDTVEISHMLYRIDNGIKRYLDYTALETSPAPSTNVDGI